MAWFNWYDNNKSLIHVATYNGTSDATREAEQAVQKGWMPQGTAATEGHINVGRTMAQVELLGVGSLLFGSSRTKGKIIITYCRTPVWFTEQEKIREAIEGLVIVIQSKQPGLNAARAERNTAKGELDQHQEAVRSIVGRKKGIATETLFRAEGVYLNQRSIDRGSLELGNDNISFTGWHGGMKVPLSQVQRVDLGASLVGPRAGIPLIPHFWSGAARARDTLLLVVQDRNETPVRRAVICDLRDGAHWQELIKIQQGRLGDVAARYAELDGHSEAAVAAAEAAIQLLAAAERRLAPVEEEVRGLVSQKQKLAATSRYY